MSKTGVEEVTDGNPNYFPFEEIKGSTFVCLERGTTIAGTTTCIRLASDGNIVLDSNNKEIVSIDPASTTWWRNDNVVVIKAARGVCVYLDLSARYSLSL